MARRADDLLSIFDPNRSSGEGGRSSGRKKRPARRRSGGKKRNFQGLYLSPKQVMLGGSAALLLLVLTFTLGLAIGRPSSDDEATSLRRESPRTNAARVMVRAEFTLNNPSTQKPIGKRAVFEKLTDEFKVPGRAVIDIRAEGDRMVVELGPFTSTDHAESYVQKWGLSAVRLNMDAPFRYHQVVDYKARGK